MMIRPYKPRDSARSALLTAGYVTDDPGLAVHPRRVLHGPAAPFLSWPIYRLKSYVARRILKEEPSLDMVAADPCNGFQPG